MFATHDIRRLATQRQLFLDDEWIGGYDALAYLNATGELDRRLGLEVGVDLEVRTVGVTRDGDVQNVDLAPIEAGQQLGDVPSVEQIVHHRDTADTEQEVAHAAGEMEALGVDFIGLMMGHSFKGKDATAFSAAALGRLHALSAAVGVPVLQ